MIRQSLVIPSLMLVAQATGGRDLGQVVAQAIIGGVTIVQLRDKSMSREDLTAAAIDLKRSLNKTPLLVNGCPMAARMADAAGVHLPEAGPVVANIRRSLALDRLVGRSVHSLQSARRAAEEGADYLIAGTIFASGSHPEIIPTGVEYLKQVCEAVNIPVIAIGGITPENAADCMAAGAAGIAVVSGILFSADPRVAAMHYRESLEKFTGERNGVGYQRRNPSA